MRATLFATLFLVGAGARAAAPDPAPSGYVVKVESGTVYLDFGEKSGAQVGQPFTVYTEGDELMHPVTKVSMGRIQNTVAEGALKLVLPAYSVGTVRADGAPVTAGMRARLGRPAPAAAPAAEPRAPSEPAASAMQDGVPSRQPRVKGPTLDYAITGMAIADFRGDGKPTVAVADKRTVQLFPYPMTDAQPLAEYVRSGTGPRILSLAAGDVNGNGRAELFVTLYNETFTRMETVVLELTDGQWKAVAEVPWMVRWHQDGSGRSVLAMQQLVADQTFPYSAIYPVTFADGQYQKGKTALRFKRVEFLYDFTQASLDGKEPALLYQTNTDLIRVQFEKGYWRTPGTYGQTPNRLRWHGRLLEFHPQMPVGYFGGKAAVYLLRNNSALGSLSEPFGFFNSGEIERQEWNGVALAPVWRAPIGGYCTSAQLAPGPQDAQDLAVAVTGTSGKSSIWIYDP